VLVDFSASIMDPASVCSAVTGSPAGSPRWISGQLPAWLRATLVKPPNAVAARNAARLLSLLPGSGSRILVVGGGTVGNGMDALYADRRSALLAFDIYASAVTQFIADAHRIPLAADSIDAVVVQAVLEHVLDPAQVVAEIHRVLRPHGLVYAETPFMQQVHAGPHDFSRFTASGHRYLFRAFEEIDAGPVAGPGTQMLWSLDHLVRGLTRSRVAGVLARVALFWLRYLDRLVAPGFAMDSASAYYFLGRASEHEIRPDEILHYYRGVQRGAITITQRQGAT
jgi:SAM-dependent methyltransferase